MRQTRKEGVLPKSIMVVGQGTYDFKEYLKKHFDAIRYVDLVFNGGTVEKAAWVLPCAGETEATGTLAAFLTDLGVDVTEKNLDENDENDIILLLCLLVPLKTFGRVIFSKERRL